MRELHAIDPRQMERRLPRTSDDGIVEHLVDNLRELEMTLFRSNSNLPKEISRVFMIHSR